MPLRLVFANLFKHPLRFLLTVGSLTVAIFLLCFLRSLVVALDAGVKSSASNRLIVQSAVSLFVNLPEAYESKILAVDGVENLTKFQWFGAYYQEPKNFFGQFGVDPQAFLDIYPEVEIVDGSVDRFLNEPTACLVGDVTAEKYGFKVGDKVPLIGTIFTREDGSPWEFSVAGIYHSKTANVDSATIYFPYSYLRESLEGGVANGPRGVGVYVMLSKAGVNQVQVLSDVDAIFENGPQRTQSTTEAEFQAQFVSMVGNIPLFVSSIGGGVLLAILLAAINTMLMSGREQTRDVGVLKALGFGDGTLFMMMLTQSLVMCSIGGVLGVLLARASSGFFGRMLGTMFPGYQVTGEIIQAGLLVTLVVGLIAGLAPALQARQLVAVEALRRGA